MSAHCRRARETVLGNKIRVSSHSFRKFYVTALEGAGGPSEWVKLLCGKSASVYSKPQDGPELFDAYVNGYEALRVYGVTTKLNGQVKALQEQVEAQSVELASVEELRIEIQDLKAALGLIETHEVVGTATYFERAKKSRMKDKAQEENE